MRDGYYGNFTIDQSLSLENIEQVEVISGPGSVLYGTNSFSSVISITTKTEGKSVSTGYGSFNNIAGFGEFSTKGLYGSINYFQTDGFSPQYNSDGYKRDHPQDADNINALLKYKNKGLTLIGSYGSYNYEYKYRSSDKDYSFNRNPIYGAAGYDFDFKEKGKLSIFSYYNYFGFNKDKTKFLALDSDVIKERTIEYMNTALFGGNIDYFIDIKKHNLLIGTSYQQDMALKINAHTSYQIDEGDVSIDEEILTNPNVSRSDIAFYIQDVWNITDRVLLTTGLRYDVLSDFEDQFSYRVGLTGQTSSNIYAKLLYGTAYRTPSYREYLDIVSFNDDLEPEHLNTFEAQVGYVFTKGDINITYFNNVYVDFIQELLIDSIAVGDTFREVDDEMAFNFDKRSISGLELNAILYPVKGLSVNFGASYMLNATENAGQIPTGLYPAYNEQGTVDIKFLSDYTMSLTTSYQFLKDYRLGIKAIYFSDRQVPTDYQVDVPESVKNASNAKGFYKVDFFASARLHQKLNFDFRIQNLLNAEIYSPPYSNSTGYDAQWTGLTFNVRLKYNLSSKRSPAK
jgi:iron complex outermembrane receptor protein